MTRYEDIVAILDEAVGGPETELYKHEAFWRQPLERFLDAEVRHVKVVVPHDGANSNLVKALRGQDPFNGYWERMPYEMDAVPPEKIDIIEAWIDKGCLANDGGVASASGLTWAPTNAPAGGDYNDVFFVDSEHGWAASTSGTVWATADGGAAWTPQRHRGWVGSDIRCLGFASPTHGWAGAIDSAAPLWETTDGGATWKEVDLPSGAPAGICGVWVVNEEVVVAAGTNRPHVQGTNKPPAIIRTTDGGRNWSADDMTEYASCLIDVYFPTSQKGWVVGALTDPDVDKGPRNRGNLLPVVLFTEDGGTTWVDQAAAFRGAWPHGDWCWKIQFLDDAVGYISLMSFDDRPGAVLRTTDGGARWERLPINDEQGTQGIKGVGFRDADHGWVGGTGKKGPGGSSVTDDGGATWTTANKIGKRINRFRFLFHDGQVTVGYAGGTSVYKYSEHPVPPPSPGALALGTTLLPEEITEADGGRRVDIPLDVPPDARVLIVAAWDELGWRVATILEEAEPTPGPRTVGWDTSDLADLHFVRVTVDDDSQSRPVRISPS